MYFRWQHVQRRLPVSGPRGGTEAGNRQTKMAEPGSSTMFLCTRWLALAVLLSFTARHSCSAAPLTIVEAGEARAVIVVQRDQPKATKAGEALQTYVAKMSGVRLPMVREGEAVDNNLKVQLLVGQTEAAKKSGVRFPSGYDTTIRPDIFEEEGYVLKTLGQRIAIGGNNDGPYNGTWYGVHALLEQLGCRWYFPGDWGEVVPHRETITVPDLAIESRPDFASRLVINSGWVPMSPDESAAYSEWISRIGMCPNPYPSVGDGFLAYLVPPNKYFDTNPEFFAMGEDGERHAGEHASLRFYENHTMLCLSNPDVFTESVKNLRATFAGENNIPHASPLGVGISPPDGMPYCYCPECKKMSLNLQYPRYFERTFQSEEFFGFAAKLAREFPDKFISTMAYSLREMVPLGVDIPENIMVLYAPIACDVLHPNDSHLWRRRDLVRALKAWRERTPHIVIYDYNPGLLIGNWVPERDTANMAVNMPIYKQIGIKGFQAEGRKAFMQTWISNYVRGKLLWDAGTDVDALQDDFYNTFFGPAAGPHVRAWWDACDAALLAEPIQVHEDFFINHIYDVAFVGRIRKHIDAALAAPASAVQRQRVAAAALIADHLLAFAEMNEAEKRLEYDAAAGAAGRMVELENRLHETYSFFIENGPGQQSFLFPTGRRKVFESLAAKTNGPDGELVAPLPLEMKFRRDRFNEGIVGSWFAPQLEEHDWGKKNTFYTWDQQDEPEDRVGHDYDGLGWYRSTFHVDPKFKDRPVKFWCGGAINEGWVWVNGQLAGHKRYSIWWAHNHAFELDVSHLIKAGQENQITIRVQNPSEIGGLWRRGFFWSPRQ